MDKLRQFTDGCDHIRKIRDFYVTFGHNMIVRELCSGGYSQSSSGSLQLLFKRHKEDKEKFGSDQIIKWLKQALQALEYSHRKAVIHKRIGKSTFEVQGDSIKLDGFLVGERNLNREEIPNWAPELIDEIDMCDVVSASTFTTKMDVWSLGATFFSLCSLRDFENEPSELARLVISEGLP